MNLYRPIHYIFGEAVFQIKASHFPRLLNAFTERGYGFWGVKPSGDTVIFCTSVFSADGMIDTASELSAELTLIERKGLPFILSGYRKRYGIFVGLAAGLFLMLYSQLFVWKLEISGNTSVPDAVIKKYLAECGVEVGSFIPNINVELDSNRFLMKCDSISSAAISIKGTHVTVSVLEATPIPDIVDRSGFYNVVAERDGIVLDVDAAEGTPEVKAGDVVFKGELLINSFIEGTNGTFRPTHARGVVYAAVEESFVTEIPFSRTTKVYTGRVEKKSVLYLLGKEMPSLSGIETEYEYFDAVASEREIKLFGFIELPLKEFCVVYNEYIPTSVPITPERAEELARAELDDFLRGLDAEVLSCDTVLTQDEKNGVCILSANAVIKRDIAREVEFDIERYMMSERLPIAME